MKVHTQRIFTSLSAPGWENYPFDPSSVNTCALLWNSAASAHTYFIISCTHAVSLYVDEYRRSDHIQVLQNDSKKPKFNLWPKWKQIKFRECILPLHSETSVFVPAVYLFIYLFVVHLTTLLVAYFIWRRMLGGYYNNDVERFIRNLPWPELM
jgi:hypothetical protein